MNQNTTINGREYTGKLIPVKVLYKCGHSITVMIKDEWNPADPVGIIFETAEKGGSICINEECHQCWDE